MSATVRNLIRARLVGLEAEKNELMRLLEDEGRTPRTARVGSAPVSAEEEAKLTSDDDKEAKALLGKKRGMVAR